MAIDFDHEDITELLQRWSRGDVLARNALFKRLYAKMLSAAESIDETSASVVHDAFVRFSQHDQVAFHDRTHFAGALAMTMRNLLIDRHRRQAVRQQLHDAGTPVPTTSEFSADRLDAVQALVELAAEKKGRAAADAFVLKIYGGLSVEEIAMLSGLSVATIGRQLSFARFFLRTRLQEAHLQLPLDSGSERI